MSGNNESISDRVARMVIDALKKEIRSRGSPYILTTFPDGMMGISGVFNINVIARAVIEAMQQPTGGDHP